MRFEWQRRRAARPWLLLRPASTWSWALVEQGVVRRQGLGRPPGEVQARVALILPAEHCSQFQVAAPPGLKRDEWPLLLEERLLQPVDQLLCVCLGRSPGQMRLLVVGNDVLSAWQQQCAAWQLPVERYWAEWQLLPELPSPAAWAWRRGSTVLLQQSGRDGQQQWLAWPQQLGDAPQAPGQPQRECFEGQWPSSLVQLERLPSVIDTQRPAYTLRLLAGQRRLLLACLALALLYGGSWFVQQWRQVQVYRQQVQALTGEQASARQAMQVLRRLREQHSERQLRMRQLQSLQTQVDAWLNAHRDWQLRAVDFDGQRWQLTLHGQVQGGAAPWQEIAASVGATAQVDEQAQRVTFDLGGAT